MTLIIQSRRHALLDWLLGEPVEDSIGDQMSIAARAAFFRLSWDSIIIIYAQNGLGL